MKLTSYVTNIIIGALISITASFLLFTVAPWYVGCESIFITLYWFVMTLAAAGDMEDTAGQIDADVNRLRNDMQEVLSPLQDCLEENAVDRRWELQRVALALSLMNHMATGGIVNDEIAKAHGLDLRYDYPALNGEVSARWRL